MAESATRPAAVRGQEPTAEQAAEQVARQAYGRLLAYLAWQWRDLAAAEDALSDAFAAALKHWPLDGVPASPEGWLMTAARRVLLQQHRHHQLANSPEVQATLGLLNAASDALPAAIATPEATAEAAPSIPDRRLQLLLVCAHPSLPASDHAPLMLQTVLGLDAQRIAGAFLISPAAMAQRLVRAKARIREAGLRFELPDLDELPARLGAVLDGIYAAYTIGSDLAAPAPEADEALREEAVFLARLVAHLQPGAAEAFGLLTLMLHAQARRPAQFNAAGDFVPLTQQDTALWSRPLMHEAETALWHAAALRAPGPFQLEAAIQSAHSHRAHTGQTPWAAIAQLYGLLVDQHGSSGARIGQAVATAEAGSVEAGSVEAGLALMDQLASTLPAARLASHQPYWVARAHLLHRQCLQLDEAARRGPIEAEAQAALQRAVGLTADPRVRRYLLQAMALPAAGTAPTTSAA